MPETPSDNQPATKGDLRELRSELKDEIQDLRTELEGLRTHLDSRIDGLYMLLDREAKFITEMQTEWPLFKARVRRLEKLQNLPETVVADLEPS